MTDPIQPLNDALRDRYRVERELGEGGMATVYMAADLKHDRKVALKVLKPELAAVVGAGRFLAEIKTTANLQHPHILPLFDSGEADGLLYYVMPFVEGESLAERLEREGELTVGEAKRIADSVAGALDYAHRQGVIHRDIKPANILLHDGEPLVADFGIALAVSAAGGGRLTETGLSLGTPHYMSPEQATAERAPDTRSDVYSLGCVLYEMLIGEPPHAGGGAQAVLARILTEQVTSLRESRPSIPRNVDAAARRALERRPADRFSTPADFAAALEDEDFGAAEASERAPVGWRIPAAAAVLAATAGIVIGLNVPRARAGLSSVGERRQVTFTGSTQYPTLSPDGSTLAFVSWICDASNSCGYDLQLQDLNAGTPNSIDPFQGAMAGPTRDWYWSVEWSPEGDRLVVTRSLDDTLRTGVYVVPRLGGAPTQLANEVSSSAGFRPDGRTVDWIAWPQGFVPGTGVWRTFDLDTDSLMHRELAVHATYLAWSPDGAWLATSGTPFDAASSRAILALVSPTGEVSDTVRGPSATTFWPRVGWSPAGDALYLQASGSLFRYRIDRNRGRFDGPAERTTVGLEHPGFESGQFSVSRDGRWLTWAPFDLRTTLNAVHGGEAAVARTLSTGTARVGFPAVSPDGEWVAYVRDDVQGSNVYVQPYLGGTDRAIAPTSSYKQHVEWSPDSHRLAFVDMSGEEDWLSVATLEGGRPQRIGRIGATSFHPRFTWYPDGEHLLYAATDRTLVRADLQGTSERLFALPDSLGVLWDLLMPPPGDSVFTVSHRFSREANELMVFGSPLDRADWVLRFAVEQTTMDVAPVPAESVMPGWRSGWALGWGPGGEVVVSSSNNTGTESVAGIWSIDPRGVTTRLLDLGPACGAPTIVSATPDLSRIVCVRWHATTDAWILDGFDPGA